MTPPTVHPFLMDLLRDSRASDVVPPPPDDHEAWGQIMRDAAGQALSPLLYEWLKESASDRRVPASMLEELKARVFGLAARNLILREELTVLLRAFEHQGVACVPMRGLALSVQLYGAITARPMGDLDLLVHKHDLPTLCDILAELGFQEMDRRPGFARAYSYTLEFVKQRHGWIIIEPHWTIAYPPFADRLDMDAVWNRCVRGEVAGVSTRLLGCEDLVLHLCLHLIHRGGSAPLLWFYELDRLLRQSRETLDWSVLTTLSRQAGVAELLLEGLGRLKELFDSSIPDQVLDTLRTPTPPSRSGPVRGPIEHRLAGFLAGESRTDGLESLTLLLSIKGLRARMRYALALLFPSPEFMRLHYGLSSRSQIGCCYLGRIAYFAWEGLKGVLSLLPLRRPPSLWSSVPGTRIQIQPSPLPSSAPSSRHTE